MNAPRPPPDRGPFGGEVEQRDIDRETIVFGLPGSLKQLMRSRRHSTRGTAPSPWTAPAIWTGLLDATRHPASDRRPHDRRLRIDRSDQRTSRRARRRPERSSPGSSIFDHDPESLRDGGPWRTIFLDVPGRPGPSKWVHERGVLDPNADDRRLPPAAAQRPLEAHSDSERPSSSRPIRSRADGTRKILLGWPGLRRRVRHAGALAGARAATRRGTDRMRDDPHRAAADRAASRARSAAPSAVASAPAGSAASTAISHSRTDRRTGLAARPPPRLAGGLTNVVFMGMGEPLANLSRRSPTRSAPCMHRGGWASPPVGSPSRPSACPTAIRTLRDLRPARDPRA